MLEVTVGLNNGGVVTYKGAEFVHVENNGMLQLTFHEPYDIERILSWSDFVVKEQHVDEELLLPTEDNPN